MISAMQARTTGVDRSAFRYGFFIVTAAMVSACHLVPANQGVPTPVLIDGKYRYCGDLASLDSALNARQQAYFANWDDRAFDLADRWVNQCAAKPMFGDDKATAARLQLLQEMRRLRSERQAETEAEIARHATCMRTAAYRQYKARNDILSSADGQANAEKMLSHEREVADRSGVIDLSTAHTAGELIVMYEGMQKTAWQDYKRAGGTATSLAQIQEPTPDPCVSR